MKRFACVLLFSVLISYTAVADDEDKNHHHHEDLTETQLGTVHFPVSCSASVQKPFARGVALLHSFWYEEAEKEFLQIANDDPHCAMAHWGVAMSIWHQLWNEPDAKVIARGLSEVDAAKKLAKKATPRENAYIAAIAAFYSNSEKLDHEARAKAYSDAMRVTFQAFPRDHEAAVFYALSLLASEPHNDETFANRLAAARILEPLFAAEPDHPGVAHYLIHAYDKPQLAERGIPAARRYAQVAPAAPHALHMPSHIFARVGLWQDDINANLASVAATRKTAAMHMGGEGHEFHAMDFLFYAYLQSGREGDAHRLMKEVKAMPPMKDMYGMGSDPRISALVAFEAMYALELHNWKEAAELTPVPEASDGDNSMTHWARAIGLAHLGKAEDARKEIAEIEAIHKKLSKEKKSKSMIDAIDQDRKEAEAWAEYAEGKTDHAIGLLRPTADNATGVFEASDEIPGREMLADMLLEMKRPAGALAEYEADLKTNPNRFNSLYGAARAAQDAGKAEKASDYFAQLVKNCEGSGSVRPELSEAKEWLAKQQNVSARK